MTEETTERQETPNQAGGAQLTGVTPIVPVRRVARSLGFYLDVLGFELRERNDTATFALIERDGVSLMLLDLNDYKAVKATSDYLSAYIWVEQVDALFAALEPQLRQLPERRFTPVFTKPDGRREFHVTDPDGFLLFFGEAVLGS